MIFSKETLFNIKNINWILFLVIGIVINWIISVMMHSIWLWLNLSWFQQNWLMWNFSEKKNGSTELRILAARTLPADQPAVDLSQVTWQESPKSELGLKAKGSLRQAKTGKIKENSFGTGPRENESSMIASMKVWQITLLRVLTKGAVCGNRRNYNE